MAFLRDLLKLTSGTVLAQSINVIAMPILARIFAPEDFGVAGLFMSIIGIGGPIMCLRYDLSIVLPKSDDDAAKLLWLCLIINMLLTLIIAFWLILGKVVFSVNVIVEGYYALIPMGLFLHGLLIAVSCWSTRKKRFGSLSVSNALRPTIANSSKLLSGIQGYINSGILIGGDLLGRGIQIIFLINRIVWEDKKLLFRKFELRDLSSLAKRYKKFPIYSSWGILLNAFSQQIPVLLLAYLFDTKIAGFYVMARYVVMMPSNMIGSALSRVFLQKAANLYSNNVIPSDFVKQIILNIFIIGILPCLILMFFAEELMFIILGSEWRQTGAYLQLLAPMSFFVFLSSPIGSLYSIYEIQEVALVLNIVRCIAHSGALFIGGLIGDVVITIALFSAIAVAVRIVDIGWILVKSNVHICKLLYLCGKSLIFALVMILPVYFVTLYKGFNWMSVSILIVVVVSYYLCIIKKYLQLIYAKLQKVK